MKKRVTTALLAACIAASLSLPCYAATGTIPPVSEVTQVVQALGIMNGDATGAMNLDAQVTRAEFITIALKASISERSPPFSNTLVRASRRIYVAS